MPVIDVDRRYSNAAIIIIYWSATLRTWRIFLTFNSSCVVHAAIFMHSFPVFHCSPHMSINGSVFFFLFLTRDMCPQCALLSPTFLFNLEVVNFARDIRGCDLK